MDSREVFLQRIPMSKSCPRFFQGRFRFSFGVVVRDFVPQHPLILDSSKFAKCFQTAPSGSVPRPGGCTNEILMVCLEDTETLEFLTSAEEDFARATVPREVSECFMMVTVTALLKRDGGVRGVATDEFSTISHEDARAAVRQGCGSSWARRLSTLSSKFEKIIQKHFRPKPKQKAFDTC